MADSLIQNIKSLAIIAPSWVGDMVMATPVIRAARTALPEAKIIGLMRRGLDDVLHGTPWLDEMIVCDMKGLFGTLRVAKAIRDHRCDAVLLLPNSFRAGLAARLSGASTRIGYNRDGRGWTLTHKFVAPGDSKQPIPMVAYYAALAEFALGVEAIDKRVELATTDEEARAADQLLHDVDRPFGLLNPGANRADKRWPAERFASLADQLASSRHRLAIVVNGSPKELDIIESVRRAAKTPIINLAERGVTLGALKAVIQRAAMVVTNDTGPRHFAAALGTPMVTLFGPTDHRWTTLNCPHERLLLAEPFLPEELVADKHPKACAIEKIAVEDVLFAVEQLLEKSIRAKPQAASRRS